MHAVANSTVSLLALSTLLMFMGVIALAEAWAHFRHPARRCDLAGPWMLPVGFIGASLLILGCMMAGETLQTAHDLDVQMGR